MAEAVRKLGLRRERDWLYFIDRAGDVSRSRKGKTEKVRRVGLRREKGWLYFLDGRGDIRRSPLLARA